MKQPTPNRQIPYTEEQKLPHFAAIVASSDDAIVSKTLQGIITSWNKAAEKIFGYTAQVAIGQSITIIIPPDRLHEEEMILDKIRRGERIEHFDTIRVRKDGRRINISVTISPIKDKKGEIIGASKIARDITRQKKLEAQVLESEIKFKQLFDEQKKAQEALRRSQEQYRLVFEHATDLITIVDPYCRYIFASPSHLSVLGYMPEELIGIDAFTLIHPDDIATAKKEFGLALSGEIGNATYRFKHKSGKWLIIESTGSAIFNDRHEPTMVVITSHDVTERTELERRKDEFISIASHELKTPITSIKVFTQLLQRHNQKEGDIKTLTYLGKMEQQIDKLTKLIGDLLDISKIQAGKLAFHKETFPIQQLITETIEIMQTTTDRHAILLDGSISGNIAGDRDRISQVLINLISNAVKYSPKANKVVVHTSQKDGQVIVGVQDFGIGIPQEYKDKIFERFFRVSGESEKTYPGFGIGLYISSEIIKRHHGKLWVESRKGRGSTFYFSLPLK